MDDSPEPDSARGNPSQENSPEPGSARGNPSQEKAPASEPGSGGGEADTYAFTVHVEPRYIPGESAPEQGRHVFAYTIVVENVGEHAARLMSRRWLITDGDGRKQEVQGPGVVGKQPRIPPGESFRYTSAAVLETAVGCMEGHYEFHADDGAAFKVPIPAFTLAMPNAVH